MSAPARGRRLRRERGSAAAGRFSVRVQEAEAGAIEAVGEVEGHPVEEQVALAIDENAHALLLVDLVVPAGSFSNASLYDMPEQPPPMTATLRPWSRRPSFCMIDLI